MATKIHGFTSPLPKTNGGTGQTTFPFYDSLTASTGSQVISSGTLADVTNSSKSVAFPAGSAYMMFVCTLQAQNNVAADNLSIALDINSGGITRTLAGNDYATTGVQATFNNSTIVDISSVAGSSVTVKLRAARVFNNFTLGTVSWYLLVF